MDTITPELGSKLSSLYSRYYQTPSTLGSRGDENFPDLDFQQYQLWQYGPYSGPRVVIRIEKRRRKMAPAVVPESRIGPHPSYIHVAQVFMFQQQLNGMMMALGTNPTREDTFRLQGVQWINDVRTALQLPIRTFCTASHYYHRFRMQHKDNEYQFHDAAAAALLTACKIEDTLKKSREILCAAHNLTKSPAEYLSPDDSTFEASSRIVIGLERLMLESSGFDFRVRYPHKHIIKLGKEAGIEKDVSRVAYNMMLDLYRTFAPLKQSCSTMAFACIELSTLLLEKQQSAIRGERSPKYRKWGTTRTEIIETILDLLDLYTHFPKFNIVGADHNVDKFFRLRITINKEMEESSLKRYTEHQEIRRINGVKPNVKTPKTPATPASPADTRVNGMDVASPVTLSPRSSGSARRGTGARGQEGTVRFMLDSDQAKREKDVTAEYFKTEYEEYEVEIEEPIKAKVDERERPRHDGPRHGFGRGGGGYDRGRGGFDRGGGGYNHHKRVRKY
ncbi:uncharacterized protein L3040_002035 [Drepanopeziza brunnea f. sp. 'multigermtubi']|uniref:RNA polymerase II holoenzyme cyclin-like subunit n=1 Tax=Marssonina brunnea f. sp. multigermtubi (strain MB_m1) TaxID=1072389 RepID=K1X3P4_MARBU|nr:uncharacterized protein MBM_01574 [Drepanopeziza brunnea f. sp. 'multigermtubi' MB_m1]EKD19622.1 hypothetical protein MBM_01574 [Drepanopeziza brunnea f. sp. 'multigermtubi' MB_m1]KAJ5052281.1 hypothetical protein L3040_002035 [Drepanopeziza brunnea f. sp. 'multigermtubi']